MTIAAMFFFAISAEQTRGGLRPDGTNLTDYTSAGAPYAGVYNGVGSGGALSLFANTGTTNAPVYQWIGSAIPITNSYAIFTGHQTTTYPNDPLYVGTSSNFFNNLSSPGSLIPVINVQVKPNYSGALSAGDIAIGTFGQPLAGVGTINYAVPPSVGGVVTSTGYGVDATISTGNNPVTTGYISLTRATVYPSFGTTPSNYFTDVFDSESGLPLSGRIMPGDSGSPVWDTNGSLIGMNVGGTTFNGDGTFGFAMKFDADTTSFINNYTETTTVCEPDYCLVIIGVGFILIYLTVKCKK